MFTGGVVKISSAFLAILVVLFLADCKSNKKTPSTPESSDFQKGVSINSQFNAATSELIVTVHLSDKLHAYAAGEKIGKPIRLEITDLNGWRAEGQAIVPSGSKKKIGTLGESVVLEGDVTLSQKVRKGSGRGEALLHLQVCSDTACDRPRVHRLPLSASQS